MGSPKLPTFPKDAIIIYEIVICRLHRSRRATANASATEPTYTSVIKATMRAASPSSMRAVLIT
jgi:hypothetical protein